MQCNKTFYDYFKENMDRLGAPCPENTFGTLTLAIATIKTLLTEIEKYGPKVTIAEIAVAGSGLEILGYLGAVGAAWYIGCCIGSLAVATGRSTSGGYSLGDLFATASINGVTSPYLNSILVLHNSRRHFSPVHMA
jgi:hypothetical protein